MPLQRRIPKRGFHNKWRVAYVVVNLEAISALAEVSEITPELLRERRLVRGRGPVKVLGNGELDRGVVVKAHAFSKSAAEKIASAGGTAEVIQ